MAGTYDEYITTVIDQANAMIANGNKRRQQLGRIIKNLNEVIHRTVTEEYARNPNDLLANMILFFTPILMEETLKMLGIDDVEKIDDDLKEKVKNILTDSIGECVSVYFESSMGIVVNVPVK